MRDHQDPCKNYGCVALRTEILNREIQLLWQWHQNPESVTEAQIKQLCPWINTLRLNESGLLVTYGELNALPDYIATPSSVDAIPKNVLLPLLQFIRQEGYIQLNKLLSRTVSDAFQYAAYVSWQSAPTILDKLLESQALDGLTLSLGIKGEDHYGGLLARNACHFARIRGIAAVILLDRSRFGQARPRYDRSE